MADFDPDADIGAIKIPQCSGVLPRCPFEAAIARLENVAKARYSPGQEFAMKATRRAVTATVRKAGGRYFWRWPFAFALALAIAVSLFHDLPALAGGGASDPIPVAIAFSPSTPIQTPDAQAPGHGCHCLCHITDQYAVSPVVTPVVFINSLNPPCDGEPIRSWAGLPPFRPPRI